MIELIKIINKENRQVVSSKEFYKSLEGEPTVWSKWVKDNITKNPFAIQGEDWEQIQSGSILSSNYENKSKLNETRGRPTTDYLLTIPFAKKLAMMTHTKKGEQIRNYFIEVEKKYKQADLSDDLIVQKAMMILDNKVKALESENMELKPKGEFYDTIMKSDDYISIGETAKILNLGFGRNTLFKVLRDRKVLMPNNQPYQEFMSRGWFKLIEQPYKLGDEVGVSLKTVVSQKGLDGIRKLLNG